MSQGYIYSDNWRNCEGRHGLNKGGESGSPTPPIGIDADHRLVPLRRCEDGRGRSQLHLLPDPHPVQLAVTN